MRYVAALLVLGCLSASPANADACRGPALREAVQRLSETEAPIKELASRCIGEMIAAAPSFFRDLDEDQVALVWASRAAHLYRPYGPSMALRLEDLIREKQLDCDNFVILTIHLFRILRPRSLIDVDMVGWERGMVGNHAQIIVNHPREPLMIDPTVGVVAKVTFDDIASGKAVARRDIATLSRRDDPPGFRYRVVTALEMGAYRPSHILYYFNNPDDYQSALAQINNWPTPAIQERPN